VRGKIDRSVEFVVPITDTNASVPNAKRLEAKLRKLV
jgi:hypothetical protein